MNKYNMDTASILKFDNFSKPTYDIVGTEAITKQLAAHTLLHLNLIKLKNKSQSIESYAHAKYHVIWYY